MENKFDAEKYAHTLNTIGTHLSMVDQMLNQPYWITPSCVYADHLAMKLMDFHVALLAMNTIYAHRYEEYKETQTNG
jgi:hypothetical protein